MTTKTDICNQGLAHLGIKPVNNLTDGSHKSGQCLLFYDDARDFVLQDHDWNFAEKRAYAELLTFDPEDAGYGYAYAYRYPSDCLKIRRIRQPVKGAEKIKYVIISHPTLNYSMVLTDEAEAMLIYTRTITEVSSFSTAFKILLGWKMSIDLALPLTKNLSLQTSAQAQYQAYLASSYTSDSDETNEDLTENGKYTGAR